MEEYVECNVSEGSVGETLQMQASIPAVPETSEWRGFVQVW